jgi:ribosomal protein S18 acetylase RimI-like enzyme
MNATLGITLEVFDRQSPYLENAAEIYANVWGNSYHDTLNIFGMYPQMPHFHGVMAIADGFCVGFAFGTQSLMGQWWHDCVGYEVGYTHPSLQQAWVLTEIAVLGKYQHRGVGLALHNRILSIQPFANVLLSTMVSNLNARRFYERLGWHYLHRGFAFSQGEEPYAIMCQHLRK